MSRYKLLFLLIGPLTLWALFFLCLYSVQAVGCEMGLQATMWGGFTSLRALVIILFLLASATVIYLTTIMWQQNRFGEGLNRIIRYCALASTFSTVVIFPGIFWLQMC
ncbi:hypothetical protein [Agrobacterium sp.]|jgi:hypothetical protein|uniref:hypothetical protein n=1 Tax=Agrobacterium sp. TaxID=361 RepID=UPI0028B115CD|nr:hypothetical protein [Agrobacterium sp.]